MHTRILRPKVVYSS